MQTVTVQIPCHQCHNPVMVHVPPQPVIYNREAVSIIVVEHPKRSRCENCNVDVVPVVGTIQGIAFTAVAVPSDQQPIIVPASAMPKGGVIV
jgi:hypothetical protein